MGEPHAHPASPDPLLRGGLFAVFSALTFGVTTPFVQRLADGAGSVAVASLLYVGAALASAPRLPRLGGGAGEGPPLRASDAPRVAIVAILGALVAPTALVWGLARTSGTSASLLLHLEGLFTVLLGAWLYREHLGRRLGLALVCMTGGGVATIAATAGGGAVRVEGAVAVAVATLAWAIDNTLTRPLADRSPRAVVAAKSAIGATLGGVLALALDQTWPTALRAALVVACGASGYGVSLRLYLLAQRRIGAGRTASIFAVAPFVGALVAVGLGERAPLAATSLGAALFAAGIYLHLTERHGHVHTHEAVVHEHAHRHDDGHHDHLHDPPIEGEHTHRHSHDARTHAHAHGPDLHHQHRHS